MSKNDVTCEIPGRPTDAIENSSTNNVNCEIPGRPTDPFRDLNDFVPQWRAGDGKPFAGKLPKVNTALKNIDRESAVMLTLPKAFFAIAGEEVCIGLDNLFVLHDKKRAEVKVSSPVGKVEGKWWRFTPDAPGRFPVKVEVCDLAGRTLGCAETELIVSAPDAGNEQNITMMMIGDSLLSGAVAAKELFRRMKEHGNKNFRLIGSHSGGGRPLELDKEAVEAYGGWRWATFQEKWDAESTAYNSKSKFIRFQEDGSKVLDFQAYLDKYNQGAAPDIILFFLGCNDIAGAMAHQFDDMLMDSINYRKKMLAHIRSVAPEALIGLVTLPPANSRDAAYLENYKGVVVRQQYMFNQMGYIQQLMGEYQDDPDYSIIPLYLGIDSDADYPENNAVHPTPEGYCKFGKCFEAWVKSLF
ncbi:MAG: hypothetical protein IJY46_10480 [Lentisphaeria bacterium]|nr:hypothetical protein [Lentisphaeria bacterium]